ncbi:MAG: c-type cytochrome biogenesis protein CcmI [Rhodobacteraceae bacterium]|nr:c-type cytochrome biogenesis protein CcmI [Paracoccaceae bacterium]
MDIWIIPSIMALGIAAFLAMVLLRARTQGEPPAAYDLRVYREQLREVDRDLARGVIAEGDAERIRTEISRRILAADAQLQKHNAGRAQPRGLSLAVAALSGVVLIGGSLLLYRDLGAPGYGDLGLEYRKEQAEERRASRPTQATAEAQVPPSPQPDVEADYIKLVEQLRSTVAERPTDIEGLSLLSQHEANLGNFKAAYDAKTREIGELKTEATALHFAEQAEFMILAAGGYVSPEAERALSLALRMDPTHGPARYYWGLMLNQIGRPDMAFRVWDSTLRNSDPRAPWLVPIRAQIQETAWRAGLDDYQMPAPPPPSMTSAPLSGPTAEDMQAASEMSEEDRAEMIRGMIDGLAQRLAEEGGTPEEWARLVTALGVTGDRDRAAAIFVEAQDKFAGNTEALSLITEAAIRAGVAE